ncbi:unnamed protein product [Mucor hiemalis]
MYSCVNENYDSAEFENWGKEAERCRDRFVEGIYVSKLCSIVEYLFDIKKNEQTAKDRLYLRAIIRYFRELVKEFKKIAGSLSRNRYVMTYPSHWAPRKVAYLRSLVQKAGIINEQDHPGRLLMYSEGASLLRALQQPKFGGIINQGCTYMICDIGGSSVKMSLFDITEPLDARSDIKGERFCEWDVNYMKKPPQLSIGLQNIIKQCEFYVLSRLSIPVKMLDDNNYQDGFLVDPGRVTGERKNLGRAEDFGRRKESSRRKDHGREEDFGREEKIVGGGVNFGRRENYGRSKDFVQRKELRGLVYLVMKAGVQVFITNKTLEKTYFFVTRFFSTGVGTLQRKNF